MNKRWRFLGLLSLLVWLAACSPPPPVKLGFIAGVSGRFADLGGTGRNGALLAVEMRNAGGGIQGRRVEMIVRDDEQNPEIAKARFAELLQAGVVAVVGPMTSSMGVALAPLGDASKTVLMGGTVTTTSLTGKDDYFFRVISPTSVYARHAAEYHFDQWKVRRVVVIIDLANADYTESWTRDYEATLKAKGGKVLNVVRFNSKDAKNYAALAAEALAARPDAVALVCSSTDAAVLGQKLRQKAPAIKLAGGGWTASERLLELGGEVIEGMLVEQYFDRSDTSEKYRKFHEAFVARFGQEPGYAGVAGYDAANVIMDALSQNPGREELKATIQRIGHFQGLQDDISFDSYGDASRRLFLTEVRGGRFVPIQKP